MKKCLKQFTDIHSLKRNEKLHAECCYILNSESVAQNTYFETKRDIAWAHRMINRHLTEVLDVVDYLFTPNGWVLVVTVKSEEEILDAMEIKGYRSRKIKNAIRDKNISVILSEMVRYCISGIARIINRYNKRGGALVRNNFDRYIFGSIETAEEVMKQMKGEEIRLCHQRKRYRASLKWYDLEGEISKKGDVFLCTRKRVKSNGMEDSEYK